MQTADFYSSATGTLRVNGGRDENAPQGVSLSIDDLSYIKQGSRANDAKPVTDYDLLDNKPQINNITLTGNKSLNDLGIQPKIDSSHKVSADNINDTDATNKFATAAQLSQIETNKNNILLLESLNGAKNYAKVGTWSSSQVGTTVITILSPGVYELNGTAGESPAFQGFNVDLPAGTYWLMGCPSGGGNDTYALSVRNAIAGSTFANDTGNGDTFTLDTAATIYINFRVAGGYTVNHVVFKPMIITMAAKNAGFTDFQPYTPTVAELYQMILNL